MLACVLKCALVRVSDLLNVGLRVRLLVGSCVGFDWLNGLEQVINPGIRIAEGNELEQAINPKIIVDG